MKRGKEEREGRRKRMGNASCECAVSTRRWSALHPGLSLKLAIFSLRKRGKGKGKGERKRRKDDEKNQAPYRDEPRSSHLVTIPNSCITLSPMWKKGKREEGKKGGGEQRNTNACGHRCIRKKAAFGVDHPGTGNKKKKERKGTKEGKRKRSASVHSYRRE